MRKFIVPSLLVALVASVAVAQPTVTLTLNSPQDGTTVAAGGTVEWSIMAQVTNSTFGLALVSTDLAQDAGNPATLDIPPADGVPTAMANFSRPAGISNPGEGGATTGYIGVQRGTAGALNLVQIGGAQNTFGQAGTTMGTSVNVVGNVGVGSAVMVAQGSFAAPATEGAYTFSLQNALANVLDQVNTPPAFSPVVAATVDVSGGSISFNVGQAPQGCPGDYDCSGAIDFFDIDLLLAALGGESAWSTKYQQKFGTTPPCGYLENCDANQDGAVDFFDIDAFLDLLGTSCP